MNKVTVNVEITNKNYSAYIDALPGCVATGATFEELQKNMKDAIIFHLDTSREFGDEIADVFSSDFDLIYKFDPESLLTHYRGIFTNAALERLTGINQRQLQRYATGETKPRPEQARKISEAFHKLAHELQVVAL
ncbi:MAG TPA: type II toxin-antitoxin system HicB family antitoxin [Petrimonas sp.]|uniref:type II toxin-antitoxin system HicB family antitoxin n=1 Tax=Petrimonas sp. TaxID=2023866 RepID=UPI00175F89A7|nr:type II toxin-antitoxin system HicB family antitoxin [Petrimonas sp.]